MHELIFLANNKNGHMPLPPLRLQPSTKVSKPNPVVYCRSEVSSNLLNVKFNGGSTCGGSNFEARFPAVPGSRLSVLVTLHVLSRL